jgi:hypothetical protein
MTSTRNKNTLIDYGLEQRINSSYQHYNMYINSATGSPSTINLPGNGLGNIGIKGYHLSTNHVDIESFLRGTGTVDLANKRFTNLTPELVCISPINIFQKDQVILPTPWEAIPERPWPI